MKKSILIFTKRNDAAAKTAGKRLADWLKSKGCGVVDVSGSEAKITKKSVSDVAVGVIIGGDGTFLTLVRRLERKDLFPLMGINLGSLGFITEIGREEMFQAMGMVLGKKYSEEKRRLMQVDLWRGNKCAQSGMVFNDAVITKDANTPMLKMDVSVNDQLLSHVRADGYIVATPTGSTGYSLSVGGALVHPEVNAILLIPICAHSLSTRPILVPQRTRIEIIMRECLGPAYVVYDGQINYEIKEGDKIRLTTSETMLRLIHSPQKSWTEILRAKLHLG